MRKVFIAALVLLMVLVGVSAEADEIVNAQVPGNQAVLFSNGYTGFCIDNAMNGATGGDNFLATDTREAVSNVYEGEAIAEYLKAAIIFHHNDLFPRYGTGGYYDSYYTSSKGLNLSGIFWMFSDREYKKITKDTTTDEFNEIAGSAIRYSELLCRIIDDARNYKTKEGVVSISDDGVVTKSDGTTISRHKIDDDTYAEFDFKVMKSQVDGVQDFFSFKITYYRTIEAEQGQCVTMDAHYPPYNVTSYEWSVIGGTQDVDCDEGVFTTEPVGADDHKKVYRCTVKDKKNSANHYVTDYYFEIRVKGAQDIVQPPVITAPQKDQTVIYVENEDVHLNVTVEDTAGVTYKWYKETSGADAQQITGSMSGYEGADSAALTVKNCGDDDDGDVYYCVAEKNGQSVTSKKFTLEKLTIAWDGTLPESVLEGGSVELKVKAENAKNYKWFEVTGTNSPKQVASGADATTYTVANVTKDDSGKQYYCVAENGDKTAATTSFVLNVTTKCVPPTLNPAADEEVVVTEGESAKLCVNATGTDLTYEWFVKKAGASEFTAIAGAAGAEYTVAAADVKDGDEYRCVVKNTCGEKTKKFTLKVNLLNPTIAWDGTLPESVLEGGSVELKVKAENAKNYKWFEVTGSQAPKQVASGADATTYTVANVTKDDSGKQYYCVAENGDKTAATTSFVLNVVTKCVPPTLDPAGEEKCEVTETDHVKLCVVATGTDLKYQWYVKEAGASEFAEITGATDDAFEIQNIGLSQNGAVYRCKVSNDCGFAEKDFVMFVQPAGNAPEFVRPDTDTQEETFRAGQTVTLVAVLKENNAESFAWYTKRGDEDAQLLEGENGNTLVLNNCSSADHGTTYYCVATNKKGQDTSMTFRLVLTGDAPVFTSPKDNAIFTFVPGESLTLTASAENADTYQWYVDKGNGQLVPIEGADQNSYKIDKLGKEQDGWVYVCTAENAFGKANSKAFILLEAEMPALPSTGDSSAMGMWIAVLLGAAAALIAAKRRVSGLN